MPFKLRRELYIGLKLKQFHNYEDITLTHFSLKALRNKVKGLTFYDQNCLSEDCLSSKPGRFLGLHVQNERFYPVTQSDGARLSVLIDI